jgi:hypothetical protein
MKTTVVNIRQSKCDVYCGRPSIYGNPYKIGRDGTRNEIIFKYIDYFVDRLCRDKNFKNEIFKLRGKTIGCWCHPLLCHCDVIAAFLNNYFESV